MISLIGVERFRTMRLGGTASWNLEESRHSVFKNSLAHREWKSLGKEAPAVIAGSCGCCEPLREDGEPRIGLQSESYGYGRLLLPVVIGWYQHTFFDVLIFVSHKRNALAFWNALVEDAKYFTVPSRNSLKNIDIA